MKSYDSIVIGGGFFGCVLALFLKQYFNEVLVIDKESDIMQRASLVNQARVHMGYHYPRSLATAFRSFVNFPKFVADFRKAIVDDFQKFYAIATIGSKVTSRQFYELYTRMGAPIEVAPKSVKLLFNEKLIENVFRVKEYAFDAVVLKNLVLQKLYDSGCHLLLNTHVDKVSIGGQKNRVRVYFDDGRLDANFVFNCTYSSINSILKNSGQNILNMKHEITELALVDLPDSLQGLSVTVMDGPFFSFMPFPSRPGLSTLSHVRYTPHLNWSDHDSYRNAHMALDQFTKKSNYPLMLRDVARYLPIFYDAQYKDSIFEVKTVLINNERDDGRPILFEKDYGIEGYAVIMGGKIDNIYEIVDTIKDTKEYVKKNGIKNMNPITWFR